MSDVVLAIDAGGTKPRAGLVTGDGAVLGADEAADSARSEGCDPGLLGTCPPRPVSGHGASAVQAPGRRHRGGIPQYAPRRRGLQRRGLRLGPPAADAPTGYP